MPEVVEVKVGQVWVDNDSRSKGRRTLRVESIGARHATVLVLTGWDGKPPPLPRWTRIRLDRFRPTSTGYRLRAQPPCPNCAAGYDCETGLYSPNPTRC